MIETFLLLVLVGVFIASLLWITFGGRRRK
jgi:hypothetical protein